MPCWNKLKPHLPVILKAKNLELFSFWERCIMWWPPCIGKIILWDFFMVHPLIAYGFSSVETIKYERDDSWDCFIRKFFFPPFYFILVKKKKKTRERVGGNIWWTMILFLEENFSPPFYFILVGKKKKKKLWGWWVKRFDRVQSLQLLWFRLSQIMQSS